MTTVAIHQPNFLPWQGYFYKILNCDIFIFLDHVGFSKGSYTNRVKVMSPSGPKWLTVPVKTSGKLGQPITMVGLSDWEKTSEAISNTLRFYYDEHPYASHVAALAERREVVVLDVGLVHVEMVDR